jgi:hypothetical protein
LSQEPGLAFFFQPETLALVVQDGSVVEQSLEDGDGNNLVIE